MFCSKCGRNCADNSKFCQGCGAPLSAPATPVMPVVAPVEQEVPATPVAPVEPTVPVAPVASVAPATPVAPPPAPKKKNTGLIIGIVIAAVAVVIAIIVALFATGVIGGDKKKDDDDDKKKSTIETTLEDASTTTTETTTEEETTEEETTEKIVDSGSIVGTWTQTETLEEFGTVITGTQTITFKENGTMIQTLEYVIEDEDAFVENYANRVNEYADEETKQSLIDEYGSIEAAAQAYCDLLTDGATHTYTYTAEDGVLTFESATEGKFSDYYEIDGDTLYVGDTSYTRA